MSRNRAEQENLKFIHPKFTHTTVVNAVGPYQSHFASSRYEVLKSGNKRWFYAELPGPSCSKLMLLLVNVSLKFQTLISQICQSMYFCRRNLKSFSHFFNKKISVFGYTVVKHLIS